MACGTTWACCLLLEAQTLVGSIAVHEPDEPVPLEAAAHLVPGLNSGGLAVDELGLNVSGGQGTLIIDHEQASDVTGLARCLEDAGVLEDESGSAVGTGTRPGQANLGDSGLLDTLNELQRSSIAGNLPGASGPLDQRTRARDGSGGASTCNDNLKSSTGLALFPLVTNVDRRLLLTLCSHGLPHVGQHFWDLSRL